MNLGGAIAKWTASARLWLLFLAAVAVTAVATAFQNEPLDLARAERPAVAPTRTEGRLAQNYVGMWVTDDRGVRHQLLSSGRYDEARGERESAYRGRYWITGNHIEYLDDTGFTADGDFIDGVLHHAGMVLHREPSS